MPSVGPFYPASSIDVANSGQAIWSNPGNATAADGSSATVTLGVGDNKGGVFNSDVLFTSGFGFSIPPTASINGILVELNGAGTGSAMLYKSSTVGTGNSKSVTLSSGSYTPLGGATDMWSTTLTPTDINSSTFGVGFTGLNSSTQNSSSASMDVMRVTVYWTASATAAPTNYKKSYVYKIYSGGAYLGNLPSPISQFAYSLDINTIGTTVEIKVPLSPDTAPLPAGGSVLDETGANVLDEVGNNILAEGAPSLVGLGTSNAMIRNGNQIVVWEYSYYWPNGHIVFSGNIERIEQGFGGDANDYVTILVYSDGQDLDQYVLTGAPFAYTADQSQTSNASSTTLFANSPDNGNNYSYFGQTFTVGTGVTNLGAINLYLNGTGNVTLNVYASTTMTSILASSTVSIATNGVVTFAFGQSIKVTAGTQYFFTVTIDTGGSVTIYYNNTNPYAGGQMFNATYNGGSGGGSYAPVTGSDLYFVTYSSNGSTTANFSAQDPSTIIKSIITDYRSRGGAINYTSSSVDLTGLSLPFQFNTRTLKEGLDTLLSAAPYGFYYYVDPGKDILYFKNASTTADIKLTYGKNIESLNLVSTIENSKNTLLFSGGVPSGQTTNLYSKYSNGPSIALYGQRLDRVSNDSVVTQNVADAIGTSEMAEVSGEQYQTSVVIVDRTMDISLLRPGMIIGFNGFGTYVDSILSQIVRVDYTPEEATLTLGTIPPRLTTDVEQITRSLLASQTIANPQSPS